MSLDSNGPMRSDPRIPLCRFVLLCMDGRLANPGDRIQWFEPDGSLHDFEETSGDRFFLWSPVFALEPPAGRGYPAVVDQLYLFAQLSNGSGEHELSVEAMRFRSGESFRLFRTSGTPLDCGNDRAAVQTYTARLKKVIFPHAGQYTFRLICDGAIIGEAHIELLEAIR